MRDFGWTLRWEIKEVKHPLLTKKQAQEAKKASRSVKINSEMKKNAGNIGEDAEEKSKNYNMSVAQLYINRELERIQNPKKHSKPQFPTPTKHKNQERRNIIRAPSLKIKIQNCDWTPAPDQEIKRLRKPSAHTESTKDTRHTESEADKISITKYATYISLRMIFLKNDDLLGGDVERIRRLGIDD